MRNQKQRHRPNGTWRIFAGIALFIAYAVSGSLRKKSKRAGDVAADTTGHPLGPRLRNIDRAVKGLADGLNEKKPEEKRKGWIGRLYDWLGAAWGKTIKAITATIILALLLSGLWQQYWSSDDMMLEHFKVPAELEKAGYSPEVVTSRLADNIKLISDNAVSHVGSSIGASATTSVGRGTDGVAASKSLIRQQTFAIASAKSALDIEVPQTRVTVKSIFLYLFESLGIRQKSIEGEITSRGNVLALTIRVNEDGSTHSLPVIEDSTGNTESLLAEGARAIYRDVQPAILASYLYSSGTANKPAALELIQDCIYQERDAALADVLWGIILLNEKRYDAALGKFEDAKNHKSNAQIDEILVSCQTRALEGKGDYEGAEKTYKDALPGRSLLTLTNYAGFLANRGYAEEALGKYEQVLSVDYGSHTAHSGKGFALELLGRYPEAVTEHREAIRLNPKSWNGYGNLALALASMKRYDEAIAAAGKAVQVEPRAADAYNTLGYVLKVRGRYDEAVKQFERAVELNPSLTYAYINWADVLLNQRKYDDALKTVDKALEIDDSTAARSERALILLNKKDYDDAVIECDLAVKKDKRFVPAYDNWVAALLGKNDYESAEHKAGQIVDIAPGSADAHNILGYVLKSRGNYEAAVKEFERAAQLNQSNTYVYVNWAETLFNQGNFEAAAAKARQAIELDDASADAHNWLGYALRSQGDFDGAMAEHERAIQTDQHNVYGYLGWAEAVLDKADGYREEERKDEYDAAEQKVRAAVERDRYSVDARNLLGRVLRKKKLYREAIAEHEEAARLDPANVYAYAGLTEAYLELPDKGSARKANLERALAAGRKAVDIDPSSADAHGELGWVYVAQGDYYKAKGDGRARAEYDKAIEQFVESKRLNPSGAYAYVGWSNALREQGECDDAEGKARKAFELAPKLRYACNELNYVLECRGQPTIKCD